MDRERNVKAEILNKGIVVGNELMYWGFDCKEIVPAIEIKDDGTILCAGYTIEELKAISQTP